jgi:hypothetical protein
MTWWGNIPHQLFFAIPLNHFILIKTVTTPGGNIHIELHGIYKN